MGMAAKRRRDDSGHFVEPRRNKRRKRQTPSEDLEQEADSLASPSLRPTLAPPERTTSGETPHTKRATWMPSLPSSLATADVLQVTVHQSLKINKIVVRCLSHLGGAGKANDDGSWRIDRRAVILNAKAPAACKAITISEILKRNLAGSKQCFRQDCKISSILKERPRTREDAVWESEDTILENGTGPSDLADPDPHITGLAGSETEEPVSFETLRPSVRRKEEAILRELEGKPQLRATPVLTIIMAVTRNSSTESCGR